MNITNKVNYTQELNEVEVARLPEDYRLPSNKERGHYSSSSSKPSWFEELVNFVRLKYPNFKCGTGALNYRIYEGRIIMIPASQKCGIEIGFTKTFAEERAKAGKALRDRLFREEASLRTLTGFVLEQTKGTAYGKYGEGRMETWGTRSTRLNWFESGLLIKTEAVCSAQRTGLFDVTSSEKLVKTFEEYKGNKLGISYHSDAGGCGATDVCISARGTILRKKVLEDIYQELFK